MSRSPSVSDRSSKGSSLKLNSRLDLGYIQETAETICQPPWPIPSASVEEAGACYFFSRYSVRQPFDYSRTFFEYLPEVYRANANNCTLRYIITALGLAGSSVTRPDVGLLHSAESYYNMALRQVNSALQDIAAASSDQTLICVLLFGLYEARSSFSTQYFFQYCSFADRKVDDRRLLAPIHTRLAETCQRGKSIVGSPW